MPTTPRPPGLIQRYREELQARNAKRIIQIIQLVLCVRLPWLTPPREQTPMLCPRCGGILQLLMVRQRGEIPILC